jgi:hypothetical protein
VRSRAALLTVIVVLAAACGDDEDASTDVTSVEGAFGSLVQADGQVLAVSTQGRAAVQQDDQLCVVDLAGGKDPAGCATVDGSLAASSVAFSPDGSKVAFDGLANMLQGLDSDVRVLDVASGEVVVVDDDGGDDPGGPQDVLPAWAADDELAFVRLPGMGGGARDTAQVGFAELDGDGEVQVVDTDGLSPRDIAVGSSAAVLDGRYVLAASGEPSRLVAVDDDGQADVVTELDARGGALGGTSRDREQAVVVIVSPTMDVLPAVHLDADAVADGDDVVTTTSPFPTIAATVSPDGSIVAAATVGGDGGRTGISLWDPAVGDEQQLEPGDGVPTLAAVRGVVWTDDDRIVLWSTEGWQVVDVGA